MTVFKLTKKQLIIRLIVLVILLIGGFVWLCIRACPTWHDQLQIPPEAQTETPAVMLTGGTQETLIEPPEGYERIPASDDSFLHFMRNMPVWPQGSSIMKYDGKTLSSVNAAAVYTISLPETDNIIAGVSGSPLGEQCPWYTEEQLSGDQIALSSYTFGSGALRRWKEGFQNAAAS